MNIFDILESVSIPEQPYGCDYQEPVYLTGFELELIKSALRRFLRDATEFGDHQLIEAISKLPPVIRPDSSTPIHSQQAVLACSNEPTDF